LSRLPTSWIECQLGEILKIRHGYAFKSTDFTKEGVPLVRQANLAGNTVDLSNCVYLPNHYLEEYQRFRLCVGDILIGMSGSIGKLCIYDKPYMALQNQRIGKVEWISIEDVHVRYIWHFLKTIEGALLEKGKGVAVANVSADDIESIPFPLAPLNEQKRIANKLDVVLARVDACRKHLDRVLAILQRFRQAVLAAATSGRLTEEWRVRNMATVPERGLTRYRLQKLADLVKEPMRNGKSVRDGDGLRVLRLSALKGGKIDWAETGRRFQSGEGWHSNENTIRFWHSSPRTPKERYSRCYASATAYGMMIPSCNSCLVRSKRPRHSRS
jgi:restriction endonuclease S subunit